MRCPKIVTQTYKGHNRNSSVQMLLQRLNLITRYCVQENWFNFLLMAQARLEIIVTKIVLG